MQHDMRPWNGKGPPFRTRKMVHLTVVWCVPLLVCNLALANTSQMQVDDLVAYATAEDHSPTLVEDSTHTSRAIARG